MPEQRKQYNPQEKVSILKRHLVEGVPVSDLCDQHGIHPTVNSARFWMATAVMWSIGSFGKG